MNHRLSTLLLLLACAPGAMMPAATIEGRVRLPAPSAPPVMNQRYEVVAHAGVIGTNPPVAIVYLDGDFPAPAAPQSARMEQKDLAFRPQLLPVQVGTRVEFPNLDDTFHNIFSYSPTKRFDLGRYRSGDVPVPSVVFDKPGMVTLRCDIHEHMRGVILVVATPYFAVTDTDGRFRLEGLPAGSFKLKAWVDSRTTLELPVVLQEGETRQVSLQ